MTNKIINRLLRAGFTVRLQADQPDHFGAEIFDSNGDSVSFESGKTLDEAIAACLIDVIESQSEQILNPKQMLADTRQAIGRTNRYGPVWDTTGL